MHQTNKYGKLYIVSTPIGNLEDITHRAIRTFNEVSLIVCEDTRRSSILLNHYGIKKPLISFFEHNENRRIPQIIKQILNGENVALISDSGTPVISDPGYSLIQAAIKAEIEVVAIPGACAAAMALVLSGLPPEPFVFLGFPPKKKSKKNKFILQIREFRATSVLFVTGRELIKILEKIIEIHGDINMAVCRELTKIHEEVLRGKCSKIIETLNLREGRIKGEITMVVEKIGG